MTKGLWSEKPDKTLGGKQELRDGPAETGYYSKRDFLVKETRHTNMWRRKRTCLAPGTERMPV